MKPDYESLINAGLSKEEIAKISGCEDQEMQIRMLRKYRYKLLDEVHEKQQSLDAIDYMICKIKKITIKGSDKLNGGNYEKISIYSIRFSLLFMLTACSSSADPSQESSGQTTSPSSQQDSVSVSNAVLESESTESEQSANNTLIVYFSRWGNTEYPSDVDATTSASIVVDNNFRYGTTEYVANMIAENVGGDLHRIETVTPYTADFDELRM